MSSANFETLPSRRCRGIAAWLATAVGVWSAIPITWHCWGLRSHDLSRATETSTNSQKQVAPASEVKVTQNISINSLAWDSDTAEIHIKVISTTKHHMAHVTKSFCLFVTIKSRKISEILLKIGRFLPLRMLLAVAQS